MDPKAPPAFLFGLSSGTKTSVLDSKGVTPLAPFKFDGFTSFPTNVPAALSTAKVGVFDLDSKGAAAPFPFNVGGSNLSFPTTGSAGPSLFSAGGLSGLQTNSTDGKGSSLTTDSKKAAAPAPAPAHVDAGHPHPAVLTSGSTVPANGSHVVEKQNGPDTGNVQIRCYFMF